MNVMKRFISCLVLVLCWQLLQAQDAQFYGVISKAKSKSIFLEYLNSPLDKELSRYEIKLNASGQFHESFPISRPLDATISNGKERMTLYLEPGLNVEMKANYRKFKKTAVLTDSFYIHQYIRDFEIAFPKEKLLKQQVQELGSLTFNEYCASVDAVAKQKLDFLDSYITQQKLNKTYVRRQRAAYRYGAANQKARYIADLAYYHQRSVQMERENFAFLETLNSDMQDLISVPEFYEFLEHYYVYKSNEKNYKPSSEFDLIGFQFNMAQSLYIDRVKNIFLTKKFAEMLESYSFEVVRSYISRYNADVHVPEYRSYIDAIVEKVSMLSPGSIAPDFTLINSNGKEFKLSDFKGKVVYLDFWATWCKPCLEEIPHLNQTLANYEGKDVVFISISMDENERDWKAKQSLLNPQIIQANVRGTNAPLPKLYQVRNVPTYVLIDKMGRIVSVQAPAPSDAKLMKFINLSLK